MSATQLRIKLLLKKKTNKKNLLYTKATDLSTSVKTARKKISNSSHLVGFPAPPSLTCDVIDYHGDSGVADVAGDETPETLLPGRVPKLQAHLPEPTKVPEKTKRREKRGKRK